MEVAEGVGVLGVLAEAAVEVLVAAPVVVAEVTAEELVVPAREVAGALVAVPVLEALAVRVVVPGRAVAMALVLVRVQEQALARVPQPQSVLVPMRQ